MVESLGTFCMVRWVHFVTFHLYESFKFSKTTMTDSDIIAALHLVKVPKTISFKYNLHYPLVGLSVYLHFQATCSSLTSRECIYFTRPSRIGWTRWSRACCCCCSLCSTVAPGR